MLFGDEFGVIVLAVLFGDEHGLIVLFGVGAALFAEASRETEGLFAVAFSKASTTVTCDSGSCCCSSSA